MRKENHVILAIHIQDRKQRAGDIQQILTDYGCSIKTRLGLHEVSESMCSGTGIIILELVGPTKNMKELMAKLKKNKGVEVKALVFKHEV